MIARLWHGVTAAGAADAYVGYLTETGIRDTVATPGNAGLLVLRRREEAHAHFLFTSFWESEEAIRRFAGADIERAVYYPRDREFLESFEPTVAHYEVVERTSARPPDRVEAYRRILRPLA